jgi:tungstate transport system ATP-binding protein
MSALLTIRGLRKRYGERELFNIDELTIEKASAYVLTGVNGAGKSTLLRIMSGLEPSEPSQVLFLGRSARLHPYPRAMRDAIVYVHQHPAMFSTSVAANIGYGLAARGMRSAEIARRVQEAMHWAGVEHLQHSQPGVLSGGEKQRIALARARVLEPKLLLLDEPTANLDGPAREQVISLIPTLVAEGSSVVMACHDRELIGLPGMRRLKLRNGALEYR